MTKIELIATTLCYGVAARPNDREILRAEYGAAEDFISGTILLLEGRRPINTKVVSLDESIDAPIFRRDNAGRDWLCWKDMQVWVSPVQQPEVIQHGTVGGIRKIADYFDMHAPKTLFISPIRECVFIKEDNRCKFCTFESGNLNPLPPALVADAYRRIVGELGFHPSVALGPGTLNKNDHGVRFLSHVIRGLRAEGCQNISAEFVPPHNVTDVDLLVTAGCRSIISSIEVWDDAIRTRLLPGKGYVSKDHYLEAWAHSVKILGRGKVSTVFIIGLEPLDSVMQGIDRVTRLGVVPTLIPYREYKSSEIDGMFTPNQDEYLKISRYNSAAMQRNGIHPRMQVGCTECGGCSLDSSMPKKASISSVEKA